MAANSEVIGGVDTFILYGAESSYGTAVTPTLMFGGLIQRSNFSVDRQNTEHAGFAGTGTADGRKTAKYTPGTVATRSTVEFRVQRFDWLEYVLLGTKTGAGTTQSPYVYNLGSLTKSLTITEEIDNVGTDSQRTYPGMVVNTSTIKCSVGQAADVSLELIGGKLTKDSSINSKVAQYTDELYNFSGGTIEMPDGTPIGNVIDSVEISISNNYEILYGFNQEAVNARPRKLSISVRFTLKYLDDDQMDKLMGSSTAITSQTPVTLALKFIRGGSQYTDFVFSNVIINKIEDSHDLNEFMIEDNDLLAASLVVTEVQS